MNFSTILIVLFNPALGNFDKAVNVIASGRGVPDSIIRSSEEVKKLRDARAEAQKQQQVQAQQQQMQQQAMQLGGEMALKDAQQ